MFRSCVFAIVVVIWMNPGVHAQTPREEQHLRQTIGELLKLLQHDESELANAARPLFDDADFSQLLKAFRNARQLAGQKQPSDIQINGNTSGQFTFEQKDREVFIHFEISKQLPRRVTSISTTVNKIDKVDTTPITWTTVGDVMDRAAKNGFDGAVLLTREGKVVLNQGYGFANREKGIENRKETVFAIGSAPIDFTHAGILLLQDRGKLSIDDPITKYFDNVPKDKRLITIKHLMNGQSGLPDFHELPTDTNPDHAWIDRGEAIRRIMNQRLLFEPGKRREHSHSGWGLLAAIIEITSGESYQEFTTENLFKPAGMTDTGFFGDSIPENRIAVGYGSQKSSQPNSPTNWGKTSWLVMGSGGQISTLTDIYRWEVATRNGSILSPDSSAAYLRTRTGVCQDGDSFGFEFMHSTDPNQLFMIISNSVNTREDRRSFDRLGNRLYRMIGSSKD